MKIPPKHEKYPKTRKPPKPPNWPQIGQFGHPQIAPKMHFALDIRTNQKSMNSINQRKKNQSKKKKSLPNKKKSFNQRKINQSINQSIKTIHLALNHKKYSQYNQ